MFNDLKNKVKASKNKLLVGVGSTSLMTIATSVPAFATSNDTAANLTTGMEGFISLVTTMINVVLGSPTLSIAFAASFAFMAVRLIRRLKKT